MKEKNGWENKTRAQKMFWSPSKRRIFFFFLKSQIILGSRMCPMFHRRKRRWVNRSSRCQHDPGKGFSVLPVAAHPLPSSSTRCLDPARQHLRCWAEPRPPSPADKDSAPAQTRPPQLLCTILSDAWAASAAARVGSRHSKGTGVCQPYVKKQRSENRRKW